MEGAVVSRRRHSLPAARREKDLATRRIKVFCTGSGSHGPAPLAEFYMRDSGRADIDGIFSGGGAKYFPALPGADVTAAYARGKVPLDQCPRCAVPRSHEFDKADLENILDQTRPGTVLRWNVSTGRLLES
jgi:hypothetical protein